MSSTYKGQPALVTPSVANFNISAVTVANPATCQTSTPHGMTTGDAVHIKGETVLNPINGFWTATVLDGTHFTVPVNAGGTSGATTGVAQPIALNAVTIPSDGDAANAASVDTPLSGEADRSAFLATATGEYKLAATHPVGAGGWQNDGGVFPVGGPWVTLTGTGGTWVATAKTWTLSDLLVGDIVDFELHGTLQSDINPNGDAVAAKLYASNFATTGSPAYAAVLGSAKGLSGSLSVASTGTQLISSPITLRGQLVVTTVGLVTFKLYLFGSGAADVVQMVGDYVATAKVWRLTGVPQ